MTFYDIYDKNNNCQETSQFSDQEEADNYAENTYGEGSYAEEVTKW